MRFRAGGAIPILGGIESPAQGRICCLQARNAGLILAFAAVFSRFLLRQSPCFAGYRACFVGGCHKCSNKMRLAALFVEKTPCGLIALTVEPPSPAAQRCTGGA
ncbi:hypothetical protein, partial [Yoonia sp. 72]|uniref:hypothetical protein n=1 Tax=Yoonia sp. 72 TaxID=3081450 RepID=UPI002AFE56CF